MTGNDEDRALEACVFNISYCNIKYSESEVQSLFKYILRELIRYKFEFLIFNIWVLL